MRKSHQARIAVGLCVLALALTGCGKLRERQAIRKYAEGAARANHKLATLRALEANILVVKNSGSARRVRQFFKERYLPAFGAYRDAVRRVPTGTARLRTLHGRYLKALDRTLEAYASYADHVTNATILTSWASVQRARERLTTAETSYRRDIAAYYRKNDVKLAAE